MNSPETHLTVAEAAQQRPCKECGIPFTPRRSWAEFCKNKCRNDFHGRAARVEAIRTRALQMYEALLSIAAETGTPYASIAAAAIKDLKAP